MSRIREFTKKDLGAVADLWMTMFHGWSPPSPPRLRSYFEAVFLDHPWRDDGLPSYVYESDAGAILGFLGVLPRRMAFGGQRLRVAVTTQLMVCPSSHTRLAAFELLEKLFAGPQDLTFSDGANPQAQAIWERLGGFATRLYSLEWTRVLKPTQYVAGLLSEEHPFRPLANRSLPLLRALDAAVDHLAENPFRTTVPSLTAGEATPATVLAGIEAQRRALVPSYDESSLRWLLTMAAETRGHGRLWKIALRDAQHKLAGWYVYYAKSGGVSQVLQFGGSRATIRHVLDHLFEHARQQGSVAVTGQVDPEYVVELSQCRCGLSCPGLGVLVQSRNPALVDAIHRGDAFLSRLEGEWWLSFASDARSDWEPAGGEVLPQPTWRSTSSRNGTHGARAG